MKAEWTNNDSLTTSQTTKAILVIDMPKDCENCLLNVDSLCAGTREPIHSIGCPLKPLPNKKEENDDGTHFSWRSNDWWNAGWNDCIDEITGETE